VCWPRAVPSRMASSPLSISKRAPRGCWSTAELMDWSRSSRPCQPRSADPVAASWGATACALLSDAQLLQGIAKDNSESSIARKPLSLQKHRAWGSEQTHPCPRVTDRLPEVGQPGAAGLLMSRLFPNNGGRSICERQIVKTAQSRGCQQSGQPIRVHHSGAGC